MTKKLIPAGKLKNLNDLVVGTSVLLSNGNVGHVTSITDVVTFNHGDIAEARLWIDLPQAGSMMHTHRRDGRSHHDAYGDIVSICRPEDTKVKAIKVWSNQPLDVELLKAGNELGLTCKLFIDTNKKGNNWKGNTKPTELNGIKGICKFGKSGMLSVKVWRDPAKEGE